MSVVLILYICHLFPPYQVRKNLILLHEGPLRSKVRMGTLTCYILTTLCDDKILICIVINSFITTFSKFDHLIHSGRNTCEHFIVLNPPLDR